MNKYPRVMISTWVRNGKKHKDLYWLVDPKKGEYLDTFTLCYYGIGQEVHYSKLRQLNKKEQRAFDKANIRGVLG